MNTANERHADAQAHDTHINDGLLNDEHIKRVKHLFMTYRNGIVADALRAAGQPYRVIFGLQLPQITEIARDLTATLATDTEKMALAEKLWNDTEVRESRLLACRLYPGRLLTIEKALEMVRSLRTREEADILAFTLLRHLPDTHTLLTLLETTTAPAPHERTVSDSDNEKESRILTYAAKALRRNLN